MSSVDYISIAIITIFTSFFASLGSELAKEIIHRTKQGTKKLEEPKKVDT